MLCWAYYGSSERGWRRGLEAPTSLRFVAALMVFLCHFPPTRAFAVAYGFGEAGVGFFFVLSGFILTNVYQQIFDGPFSASAAWDFHRARIARIYPVHLVTMAMCLAWFIPFGSPEWNSPEPAGRIATTTAQAFLLQSWLPNPGFHEGLNVVSWSISVEAFFYALFPSMLWLMLKGLRRSGAMPLLCGAWALWLVQLAFLAPLKPGPVLAWALYELPPFRLFDFAAGMLAAIAFSRRNTAKLASGAELGAISAVIAAIVATPHVPEALRYGTALIPFWAALIYTFALQAGPIAMLLSHPWCICLGEVSFAFYMVHYVVLVAEDRLIGWGNPLLSFCLGIAVVLILSFALFRFVETPMRIWIRGATRRGTAARPVPI